MLPAQDNLAFEQLGWSSFQDLGVAFAEDLLNLPAATFSPVKDRGIDGIIEPIFGAGSQSTTVVQVKHSSSRSSLTLGMISGELAKVQALAATRKIDHYLIVTNLGLTVGADQAITNALQAAGIGSVKVIGRETLSHRIRSSARLRGMVPRLYGIGDLSQILDERRLTQSSTMLASARIELDKFVVTNSYRNSFRALREHRLLMLLGDPAVGKSTIARCLCVAALDEFDARPLILEKVEQIADHWNPEDPLRVFWIDDAFGVTQKIDDRVEAFNRTIPLLNTAIRHGSRVIITSRSYIWNLARDSLKLSNVPNYDRARVEIDVRQYTEFERAQIVYNHLKLGDQPKEWRKRVKPFLPLVVRHYEFKPEVARRLGMRAFTTHLALTADSVRSFVDNPARFLEGMISELDEPSKAALAALLLAGGSLPYPIDLDAKFEGVCELFGVRPAEIRQRFQSLEGSLLKRETDEDGQVYWRFWHPTIGEALAAVARSNAELLDVYLRGAAVPQMMREIACAGQSVSGAIIEVGPNRFELIVDRMRQSNLPVGEVLQFLAHRATDAFRRTYFAMPAAATDPCFADWLLTTPSAISLVKSLVRMRWITDSLVEKFRAAVRHAITYEANVYVLDDSLKATVGEDFFRQALGEAVSMLRDSPDEVIEPFRDDIDGDVDPDDHFYPIYDFAERLLAMVPVHDGSKILENLREHLSYEANSVREAREDALSEEEARLRQEEEERFAQAEDDYYAMMNDRKGRLKEEHVPALSVALGISGPPTLLGLDPVERLFSDLDE